MVGGIVTEVAEVAGRSDVLFIDCCDPKRPKDTCAIYVSKNEVSQQVQVGDSLWWQGRKAYWTAQGGRAVTLTRVGYSGVKHPFREGME